MLRENNIRSATPLLPYTTIMYTCIDLVKSREGGTITVIEMF